MAVAFSKIKGNTDSIDFHSHEHHEIYIFHGGNCRYIVDKQIIDLIPGTILLLNGRAIHKVQIIDKAESYKRSTLHFLPGEVAKELKKLNCEYLLEPFQNQAVSIFHLKDKEDLERVALMIDDVGDLILSEEKSIRNFEIVISIIKILLFIKREGEKNIPNQLISNKRKNSYSEKIIHYIQSNYREPIIIKDISRSLYLSESYTSKVFKETTGNTVMNYLMEYRFTQAKYLLETSSDLTLTEIASLSGFQSLAHFSHYIKNKTQMSPTKYQKLIQEKSNISPQQFRG